MLASDWRLSGSFRASSRPLTVTTGVDRALTGAPNVQRTDQVLDDPYGKKTWDNWLNPAASCADAVPATSDTIAHTRQNVLVISVFLTPPLY